MYDAKMSRGIGILISRDAEYFQVDWCHVDLPWRKNLQMDEILARNSPFRKAKEKSVNSFLFRGERE